MLLQHTDNANTASNDESLLEDDEFSLLDEAEHVVAQASVSNSDNDNEPYAVADAYPDVQLAEGVLESLLSDDPDAASLADMLEDLQCQLETVKRRLEARTMELQNKAKAEAVARQQEEDENAIMGAIEDPEYRSVLADVVRLLDKGQAGPLLDIIQGLKGNNATTSSTWQPDTATKLTTAPLPEVAAYVEPVTTYVSKPAPTTNTSPGWL
jgi:hypothetical protein